MNAGHPDRRGDRRKRLISGGHLRVDEVRELAGDRGDDGVARVLALPETPEAAIEANLGPLGALDRLRRVALLKASWDHPA